ncbi:hypothetical protein B0H13DRAFT_1852266 [Mycena leptocephala]|nr:hypothetical protein B0H13DRAFT_1852266 [Mycena leptocephala]
MNQYGKVWYRELNERMFQPTGTDESWEVYNSSKDEVDAQESRRVPWSVVVLRFLKLIKSTVKTNTGAASAKIPRDVSDDSPHPELFPLSVPPSCQHRKFHAYHGQSSEALRYLKKHLWLVREHKWRQESRCLGESDAIRDEGSSPLADKLDYYILIWTIFGIGASTQLLYLFHDTGAAVSLFGNRFLPDLISLYRKAGVFEHYNIY